jgi:hypothetical protein
MFRPLSGVAEFVYSIEPVKNNMKPKLFLSRNSMKPSPFVSEK